MSHFSILSSFKFQQHFSFSLTDFYSLAWVFQSGWMSVRILELCSSLETNQLASKLDHFLRSCAKQYLERNEALFRFQRLFYHFWFLFELWEQKFESNLRMIKHRATLLKLNCQSCFRQNFPTLTFQVSSGIVFKKWPQLLAT